MRSVIALFFNLLNRSDFYREMSLMLSRLQWSLTFSNQFLLFCILKESIFEGSKSHYFIFSLTETCKFKSGTHLFAFHFSPSNFEEGEFERPKSDSKEEKKRRSSVFSKLGSYRQKKLVKDTKAKSIHQFVPVSFSNSTACDVCNKSMANKAALQCESKFR